MTPPSITYWNRLEPRPRAADLGEALAARAYDPAWLLARQWQLGEFQGEDAGAPAFVRLAASMSRLTARGTDGGTLESVDATQPLEPFVTAEPTAPDQLARAVELGQTLERWLAEAGVPELRVVFREAYPIAAVDEEDPRARRLRSLWRGRAIDGLAVWAAAQQPVPPPPPGVELTPAPLPGVPWEVPAAWRDQAGTAVMNLLGWSEILGSPGAGTPPGWQSESLSARPRVYGIDTDKDPVAFSVTPDRRGDIDWFAFDGHDDVPSGVPEPAVVGQTVAVIPGPVRFRGMPNERFWDFEDARYAIDAIRPDRRNLASMILLDFMLVHGNDWYLVPFAQPLGTMCTSYVEVVDVFGVTTGIPRAEGGASGAGRFAMFAVDEPGGGIAPYHLVPASASASVQEGPPLEEVRFLRDEMANLVWAVEHTTEGSLGRGRRAADRAPETIVPEVPLAAGAAVRYRLQSSVPRHWFPLAPVKMTGSDAVMLELAGLLTADSATPIVPTPVGRNLTTYDGKPLHVREEQVPREGTQVRRGYRRTRGANGSTHVWLARTRRIGTGEGSADLRFDAAVDAPPSEE